MAWALSFNGVDEWATETAGLGVTLTGEYEVIFKYNFISGPGKIADSVSSANRWDIQFSGGAGLDARTYMTWDVDEVNEGDIPTGVPFTLKVYRTPAQTDQTDKNFATLCARFNFITPLPCEVESIEINNGVGGTDYFFSATDSDHNTSPPVLIDTLGTGVTFAGNSNMTDANWINLGGGTIVDFTFSINTASLVSADTAFIISSDFQISTASEVSFASAKVQQSDFDITSQSSVNFESAKIQSSIFEIDSSSMFSVLTGDTNIVEFTFSINSQSSLSADSAKVQTSEFNVDSGANVDWSASAIQGRTLAIDSESTFTVVIEGGEPVFIIGLTLELSSDIITLELSSEQEIRELA